MTDMYDALRWFEDRLIEVASAYIAPFPGNTTTPFGARGCEWTLRAPIEQMSSDAAFLSSLGWVAHSSTFTVGRVLQARDRNLELQQRLRTYL